MHTQEWPKSKELTILSVDEDVQQLDLSYIMVGV